MVKVLDRQKETSCIHMNIHAVFGILFASQIWRRSLMSLPPHPSGNWGLLVVEVCQYKTSFQFYTSPSSFYLQLSLIFLSRHEREVCMRNVVILNILKSMFKVEILWENVMWLRFYSKCISKLLVFHWIILI